MTDETESTTTAAASAKAGAGKGRAKGAGAKAAGARKGAARAAGAKAGKAGGARPAGAGAKGKVAKAAPAPITGPVEGGTLKTKELIDRVVARSGAGRMAAKPVVDAVLVELAESLARGESFVLPPLGRGKIRPAKEGAKEGMMTLRINKGGRAKKDDATPLAPAEE